MGYDVTVTVWLPNIKINKYLKPYTEEYQNEIEQPQARIMKSLNADSMNVMQLRCDCDAQLYTQLYTQRSLHYLEKIDLVEWHLWDMLKRSGTLTWIIIQAGCSDKWKHNLWRLQTKQIGCNISNKIEIINMEIIIYWFQS